MDEYSFPTASEPAFSDGESLTITESFDAPPEWGERVEETEPKSFLNTDFDLPTQKKGRQSQLQRELANMYSLAGVAVFQFNPPLAQTILAQADPCAESLYKLAQQNPKIKRALESLTQTSAWGAVIIAHLPIAIHVATAYVPALRENFEQSMQAAQQAQQAAQDQSMRQAP